MTQISTKYGAVRVKIGTCEKDKAQSAFGVQVDSRKQGMNCTKTKVCTKKKLTHRYKAKQKRRFLTRDHLLVPSEVCSWIKEITKAHTLAF